MMNIPIFGFKTTRRFAVIAIVASFIFSNVFAVGSLNSDKTIASSSAMAKYTTNLTQLGRDGRLRENLSVEKETIRLINMLAEGGVRQPVIIDEDKGVQDAIVEQVALRIAKGAVPAKLAGRSIIKLETDALFSNERSDPAPAINAIVRDLVASKGQAILFVDELTNLVGAHRREHKSF